MGAITTVEWEGEQISVVNQDECVECCVCLRAEICPTDAIEMPELEWPRAIRAAFSNPVTKHPTTKLEGRGTEEMKTNDVTGRFRRGVAGVAVEMGRPGIGTTFKDVQKITMALMGVGVEFEPENPLSSVIANKATGALDEDILNEKVLSAIIEFKVGKNQLKEVFEILGQVSTQIDTVFSLDLIARIEPDGSTPLAAVAREAKFIPRPNTKTNVGLGRPLKEGI
jgi:hypothetical protein